MKRFYLLYLLAIVCAAGCYDDLGNYDYRDINELEVEGIEAMYARDVDDSLHIYPQLKGTQYSDTSRFSYKWEIGGQILAETHDLHLLINLRAGEKKCRFIVTDKNTGIQTYTSFRLNVSSSTAGDLILVLSKYNGRAELSYLRLDKPSNWAVNYYQDRFGKTLGTNPQQLLPCYIETTLGSPLTCRDGRLMVLCDDQAAMFDKSTMMQDTIDPYITGNAYTGVATWPPTDDVENYKTQFMSAGVTMWRTNPYGNDMQESEQFYEISGGTLYTLSTATNGGNRGTFKANITSYYSKGYLCPFGYWDDMSDNELGHLGDMGRTLGSYIMFDRVNGKFTFYDGSHMRPVADDVPVYEGYELLWGSATNLTPNNRSLAILNKGDETRLVMLETGKDPQSIGGKVDTKHLVSEVNGGIINASSKFYVATYVDYLYFTVGNAFYCYTIGDMYSGVVPGRSHKQFDLTQYGYDADAVITDICVSRSEKTLLVGVSRYGTDAEALGEEAKGDVLYFDLDVSGKQFKYNEEKSAKGIAGIPVDVEIKYQTYWRNGREQDGVTLKDNI